MSIKDHGFKFLSDTDTEVIAHLIAFHLKQVADLFKAICLSIEELRGAYAIAVIEEIHPERIIAARNGVRHRKDSNYVVYLDASVLLQATRDIIYPGEGDVAELRNHDYRIVNCLHNQFGETVNRIIHKSLLSNEAVNLGILCRKRSSNSQLPWRIRRKWYQMRNPSPPICIPLQLLAYHVALEKGTDVDKPRNLANAVTVE